MDNQCALKRTVNMNTINEERFTYIVHPGVKANSTIFDDAINIPPEDIAANL
jgi:hypothetical protein